MFHTVQPVRNGLDDRGFNLVVRLIPLITGCGRLHRVAKLLLQERDQRIGNERALPASRYSGDADEDSQWKRDRDILEIVGSGMPECQAGRRPVQRCLATRLITDKYTSNVP